MCVIVYIYINIYIRLVNSISPNNTPPAGTPRMDRSKENQLGKKCGMVQGWNGSPLS